MNPSDPASPQALLTIDEVAGWLRCSVKSIRRRVRDGLLHPVPAATRRLLFRQAEVAALLTPGGINPPAPPPPDQPADPDLAVAEGVRDFIRNLTGTTL